MAHPAPATHPELGYPELTFVAPAAEAMVEEVGDHEPLLSFPGGLEDEPDWPRALDAMIAARLLHA